MSNPWRSHREKSESSHDSKRRALFCAPPLPTKFAAQGTARSIHNRERPEKCRRIQQRRITEWFYNGGTRRANPARDAMMRVTLTILRCPNAQRHHITAHHSYPRGARLRRTRSEAGRSSWRLSSERARASRPHITAHHTYPREARACLPNERSPEQGALSSGHPSCRGSRCSKRPRSSPPCLSWRQRP